jgi:hypothetical protein
MAWAPPVRGPQVSSGGGGGVVARSGGGIGAAASASAGGGEGSSSSGSGAMFALGDAAGAITVWDCGDALSRCAPPLPHASDRGRDHH